MQHILFLLTIHPVLHKFPATTRKRKQTNQDQHKRGKLHRQKRKYTSHSIRSHCIFNLIHKINSKSTRQRRSNNRKYTICMSYFFIFLQFIYLPLPDFNIFNHQINGCTHIPTTFFRTDQQFMHCMYLFTRIPLFNKCQSFRIYSLFGCSSSSLNICHCLPYCRFHLSVRKRLFTFPQRRQNFPLFPEREQDLLHIICDVRKPFLLIHATIHINNQNWQHRKRHCTNRHNVHKLELKEYSYCTDQKEYKKYGKQIRLPFKIIPIPMYFLL